MDLVSQNGITDTYYTCNNLFFHDKQSHTSTPHQGCTGVRPQSYTLPVVIILKPESVAVSDSPELVHNNCPEELPGSAHVSLQHPARPDINVIKTAIVQVTQAIYNLETRRKKY